MPGMSEGYQFSYKPDGEQLKNFLKSDAFVRGIRGPVGSGKSVGCCIDIFKRACEAPRCLSGTDSDGKPVYRKRRSRWAVIRNTNSQLKTTTIKTWLDWFPEEVFGTFKWSVPYTHLIEFGDVELEVIFLALDRPEDVRKLLSLELTGVWINEAREVPKPVIDGATSRVGRYPQLESMETEGWYGVIMDTNAPEADHWWPIMAGDVPKPDFLTSEEALMLVKPDDWAFFNQPPGMLKVRDTMGQVTGYVLNPMRENGKFVRESYYTKQISGKTSGWIAVYVLNEYGSTQDGRPVYAKSFRKESHVVKEPIKPVPGLQLRLGIDFGRTPSAVFGQRLGVGRWLILREVVASDMGARVFAGVLNRTLQDHYPEYISDLILHGDPSGDYMAQTDDHAPFDIMRAEGLMVREAPTNDPLIRIESVELCLERFIDGAPGMIIDPNNCPVLVSGFDYGYAYKRMSVSGEARFEDKPSKNKFSHVHDALQYLVIGGGEGRTLIGATAATPVIADHKRDPFARQKAYMTNKGREKQGWSRLIRRGL